MQSILVDLRITRDEWLKIYRGQTNRVYARARDGRSIQFPANILTPYIEHEGVFGSFLIQFDDQGKFANIQKL